MVTLLESSSSLGESDLGSAGLGDTLTTGSVDFSLLAGSKKLVIGLAGGLLEAMANDMCSVHKKL